MGPGAIYGRRPTAGRGWEGIGEGAEGGDIPHSIHSIRSTGGRGVGGLTKCRSLLPVTEGSVKLRLSFAQAPLAER